MRRKTAIPFVILDTAGRLHVDEDMMQELARSKKMLTWHRQS